MVLPLHCEVAVGCVHALVHAFGGINGEVGVQSRDETLVNKCAILGVSVLAFFDADREMNSPVSCWLL